MVATVDVFEVLADPTRRQILRALRGGEHAVGELVAEVDINQPGVSKQLRVLYDAGFVEVRRDRQRRLYSLRAEPFHELDAWIQEYRALWEARFDRLAAQLESRQKTRDDATETGRHPSAKPREGGE